MGCKAAETICNNNAFGPKTANQCTGCRGGSRSFAKETRALKMRRIMVGHQNLTTTNWEDHWSWSLILLKLHEKLLKNSMSSILWLFGIWSKLERWKSWISGCRMSWLKVTVLKCHIFLFLAITTKHFLIGLGCVTKSRFYTTISDD